MTVESVSVGGAAIAWRTFGSPANPPVILLHSLGYDGSMWAPQAEALADSYRVIVVDTRGHGRSAVPAGPYRIEQLGQDVLAVADAAGASSFHVCGVSLGGMMALWLAIHQPERVRSLVACNTAAKLGSEAMWGDRIELIRSEGMAGASDAVVARWFGPGFAEHRPDWFANGVGVFEGTDPEGYIGCCGALAAADLRDDVQTIGARTLLVGGRHDVSTPPSDQHWLQERIGGSDLVVFGGAAHISNLDRPDEFIRHVRGFLDDAERALNEARG